MQMTSEAAFIQAYEAHSDAIFRHCYFRVYQRELAADLMQQTFLKAWKCLADGQTVENLRAFLYKIANNLVIDEMRKNSLRHTASLDGLEESGFEPGIDSHTEVERTIDGAQIRPYLEQLVPADREILILRYIDDLSPKEIAEVLAESANVISVRINRALKKLRALLPNPYVFTSFP